MTSLKIIGQTLTYSFIDPCTKDITYFSIPIQSGTGTMIFFLGKQRYFTSNDVTSGDFATWINQVYADYRKISPCGVQQGQVTQNQITSQIIGNTIRSVVDNVIAQSQSESNSPQYDGVMVFENNNNNSKDKKKSKNAKNNSNSSSNNSNNNSGGNGTDNSNTGNNTIPKGSVPSISSSNNSTNSTNENSTSSVTGNESKTTTRGNNNLESSQTKLGSSSTIPQGNAQQNGQSNNQGNNSISGKSIEQNVSRTQNGSSQDNPISQNGSTKSNTTTQNVATQNNTTSKNGSTQNTTTSQNASSQSNQKTQGNEVVVTTTMTIDVNNDKGNNSSVTKSSKQTKSDVNNGSVLGSSGSNDNISGFNKSSGGDNSEIGVSKGNDDYSDKTNPSLNNDSENNGSSTSDGQTEVNSKSKTTEGDINSKSNTELNSKSNPTNQNNDTKIKGDDVKGEITAKVNGDNVIVPDNSSDGGKGSKKTNPIIISSDLTNAQNLDRSYVGIINVGMSQTSMTGTSSWGVNSMIWFTFRQFAISGRYTKIQYSKNHKLKLVHNFNLTGVYSYGNILGFLGYSAILNAGKFGITGVNISGAVTKTPDNENLFISPTLTAFYTKQIKVGKRLILSPELYVISTPLIYSSLDKVSVTDRTFSAFIGTGIDYQISKRFKVNLNYKLNMSTNPEFPILSFLLIGSKINL